MKQMRYYELFPIATHDNREDQTEVTVEALDDAVFSHEPVIVQSQITADSETQVVVEYQPARFVPAKAKRPPRKQKIEYKKSISVEQDKFQCYECGMVLANSVTLRRHIERVKR